MSARTLVVEPCPGGAAPRLDHFLQRALPGLSRRLLRRLVAAGEVAVNGRRAAKGLRLSVGDRVTLPDLAPRLEPEPALALEVLHEDELLVALAKPGGMRAHALDPRQRGTAAAFLVARYPEMAEVGDALGPGLVHRLDTGTSGLLLAVRTAAAHSRLRAALRARRVEKRYCALVAGEAAALDGRRICVTLAHDSRDRRRMTAAPPGARAWPAETAVRVLRTAPHGSFVEATIRTGVTHQVRVHLALAGHPVVNDTLYGAPPAPLPPGRHALHAATMTLPHPRDDRPLTLECPLAPDLAALLESERSS